MERCTNFGMYRRTFANMIMLQVQPLSHSVSGNEFSPFFVDVILLFGIHHSHAATLCKKRREDFLLLRQRWRRLRHSGRTLYFFRRWGQCTNSTSVMCSEGRQVALKLIGWRLEERGNSVTQPIRQIQLLFASYTARYYYLKSEDWNTSLQ